MGKIISEDKKLWYKIARNIIKAGGIPLPVSESLIEISKTVITEDQAKKIILHFKKPSMNIDQLITKTKLDKKTLIKMLNNLIRSGVIVALPSRNTGDIVYYLLGPVPGIFERTFMTGKTGEREKKLAKLFEAYFKDIGDGYKNNYDDTMKLFEQIPPIYRIVPIEEEIEEYEEYVLPYEEVSKIIEKFDIIAVSDCYCRHQRELLNDACKINAPKKNCLTFGKNARFNIEFNFGEEISKDEAKILLKEAEDIGLVHRAFHARQDPKKDEFAICNCCKCCCEISHSFYNGEIPINALTSYKALVFEDLCVGCEICVEKCPMEAIKLTNSIIQINMGRCIGCGICAYHCPQEAMKLERTGPRKVIVPIPKVIT
ncbi:MAG: DUF362 domain-containing protein [Promethearchaeota archaeon]